MAIIHSSYITQPAYLAVDNRGASSKLYVADNTEQRINIFDADGEVEALFTITNSRIGGKPTVPLHVHSLLTCTCI